MPKNALKNQPVELSGNSLDLAKIFAISNGCGITIAPAAKNAVDRCYNVLLEISRTDDAIYGVNTGFGYLAKEKIADGRQLLLQKNLLKSHAAGYGPPLSIPETRAAMALRLNVLLRGHSGVSFALCCQLRDLLNAEIYPVIPDYGSVGASGDLAPLAHLALPLIGEGEVLYKDRRMPAKNALKMAAIKPYRLKKKEGLALINGTQIMLARGSLSLYEASLLLEIADKAAALAYEGLNAWPQPLHPFIHAIRGHEGQRIVAETILKALEGSDLVSPDVARSRVQDPYSLRCVPQIHGPSREAVAFAIGIVEKELSATTDNPLVSTTDMQVFSGGNFHGQYLAMAFDFASIALAELGNVSERRLELFLNPHISGLPAFLVPENGVNSGYMAAQYLSASLVNENKLLANPSCTDSIPGNVGIEDHVSMGMTSARKLGKIVENLKTVLAVELLAGAQAVHLRGNPKLGKGTRELYRKIRKSIPPLLKDRVVAEDIKKARKIIEEMIHDTNAVKHR